MKKFALLAFGLLVAAALNGCCCPQSCGSPCGYGGGGCSTGGCGVQGAYAAPCGGGCGI